MRPRLWQWLLHPKLTMAVRIALGLVFIAAALPKIGDPPGFAKAIWAYQLVPGPALNPMALVLPWLELFCGLALCLGIWIRAAAAWVAMMLLAFGFALSINLARHHPVDCGCFGGAAQKTMAEQFADMRWSLLRDAGLLLLAGQVLLASGLKARSVGQVE
ncbi:MAG TPA: MauE/DoxX family redox-associated membrane protein [Geothrix sp.]